VPAIFGGLQPLSHFHLNDDISIELDDIARSCAGTCVVFLNFRATSTPRLQTAERGVAIENAASEAEREFTASAELEAALWATAISGILRGGISTP